MNILPTLKKVLSSSITIAVLMSSSSALDNTYRLGPPDPLKSYKITPDSGRPGTYEVLISSNDSANCADNQELSQARLKHPQGSRILVRTSTRLDACTLSATLHIPADAPVGETALWVVDDEEKVIGTARFSVTHAILPGQIPHGIEPPAVDVMWLVLPEKLVGHSFGKSIAENYYAIEIIIGNNSAYNLHLVSVGFKLPPDRDIDRLLTRNIDNRKPGKHPSLSLAEKNAKSDYVDTNSRTQDTPPRTILPTSSYRITRGSLESRQLLHPRNLVVSAITALGPLLTGFVPYFHNVNHRANFSEGVNIFSNPLEKGLQLVWPDPRSRQRERFDDQVLRDGLLIRNNTQTRTIAFFPKELLRLPAHVESYAEYKAWRNNAREVRERLGEIVIIGDLVQHVNRISLTPGASEGIAAPPTISGLTPTSFQQGQSNIVITLQGSNLENANLVAGGTEGINFSDARVDPTGHVITARVSVDDSVAPENYSLIVSTPSGRDERLIRVTPEAFRVTEKKLTPTNLKERATAQTVRFEIVGLYLHNVKVSAEEGLTALITKRSADGTKIAGEITVSAGMKVGEYKIELNDSMNPNAKPAEVVIVVQAADKAKAN